MGGHMMARFAVLFACITLLFGCMSNRWVVDSKVVKKDHSFYVEHQTDGEKTIEQGYAHPATINTRELALILKGLRYEVNPLIGRPEPTPVFLVEEAEDLAGHMTKLLKKANPNQRIHFISHSWKPGVILKDHCITEGVVFMSAEHRLNIAFNYLNEPEDLDEIMGGNPQAHRRDPVNITKYSEPLLPTEWCSNAYNIEDDELYPLWTVVDLNKTKALLSTKIKEVVEKSKKKDTLKTPKPEIKEEKKRDLESKLQRLKDLFDKGLIDEQEYKAQKKKLLEELN